jgi:hypothetical protein
MIGQLGENVWEPSLRIDVVELGDLDQRVDGGGAATAIVGAVEGLVPAAHDDGAQFAFGGVVGPAQAAVIKEAGEHAPALEAVVDRLGGLAFARELGAPGA